MENKFKIGFIGLGIMGEHMCRNIMRAGFDMTVFDIDEKQVAKLVSEGAHTVDCPAAVAKVSDITITMVPNNSIVEQIALGEKGILEGMGPGKIYIDMSTISPDVSRKVAISIGQTGGVMIDAPVVKSQPAAITGDLGILVGGPKELYEKILPVLIPIGKNVIYMGNNGAGLVMKLCHNMLVGEIAVAVSETLTMATKAGLDFEDIATAISYGGGQTFFLDSKKKSLMERDFVQRFPLQYMRKDMGLALELGRNLGVQLPEAVIAEQLFQEAMDMGMAKEDFSAVIKVVEKII